jgi:hypothetical protein
MLVWVAGVGSLPSMLPIRPSRRKAAELSAVQAAHPLSLDVPSFDAKFSGYCAWAALGCSAVVLLASQAWLSIN